MALDPFNSSLLLVNSSTTTTFANGTTILFQGMTDLDLIVDYCTQINQFMVVFYLVPLTLILLRWYANNRARKVEGWKEKHMKLWLWVDDEIFGWLFIACALDLSIWVYAWLW